MISRIRPAWARALTNAHLLDQLDKALEVNYDVHKAIIPRLDILCAEISRREQAGTLTEKDWTQDASPPAERTLIANDDGGE